MKYCKDKYGNDLSVLGYGCMRFPKKHGKIDMDIAEYDTRVVANMYLQSSLYTGTIKKLISALMVMADEFDIFPPKEVEDYTVNLLLTYHTHDIFLNGRKITDLDWDD